jgi:hypothetical protein
MVPAVVIMQALTKYDEQIFELLGLRIKTSLKTLANAKTAKRDTLVLPHGAKRDNWY